MNRIFNLAYSATAILLVTTLDELGPKVVDNMPDNTCRLFGSMSLGHEFNDVKEQLCGKGHTYSSPAPSPGQIDPNINNSGYVSNYSVYDHKNSGNIMKCYLPEQLPVLNTLAKEFAVCDHWFSSMPGLTWPNRFFIHVASSGGLDDSPSSIFGLARSVQTKSNLT